MSKEKRQKQNNETGGEFVFRAGNRRQRERADLGTENSIRSSDFKRDTTPDNQA